MASVKPTGEGVCGAAGVGVEGADGDGATVGATVGASVGPVVGLDVCGTTDSGAAVVEGAVPVGLPAVVEGFRDGDGTGVGDWLDVHASADSATTAIRADRKGLK